MNINIFIKYLFLITFLNPVHVNAEFLWPREDDISFSLIDIEITNFSGKRMLDEEVNEIASAEGIEFDFKFTRSRNMIFAKFSDSHFLVCERKDVNKYDCDDTINANHSYSIELLVQDHRLVGMYIILEGSEEPAHIKSYLKVKH